VLIDVRRRLRERQLAGDERAGDWARGQARRLQWHFIRRSWRLLAGMLATAALVTSTLLIFVHGEFQRGLIVGAAVVGTVSALAVMVMQLTGTASISMGASAEQWTVSELRPLRKAGWKIINHVALQRWDIDHVLVGPRWRCRSRNQVVRGWLDARSTGSAAASRGRPGRQERQRPAAVARIPLARNRLRSGRRFPLGRQPARQPAPASGAGAS
jgi:hypothetical protein